MKTTIQLTQKETELLVWALGVAAGMTSNENFPAHVQELLQLARDIIGQKTIYTPDALSAS